MKSFSFSSFRWFAGAVALWLSAVIAQAAPPPSGTVGSSYSYQITTTPAAAAGTVYSATNLPPGLGIGSSTGLVSGTPTVAGTYSGVFSLTANSVTNNLSYSIVIQASASAPALASPAPASAAVAAVFAGFSPTVTNAVTVTSYNVTGLPPGLTANTATGAISGTPTTPGTYTVSLSGNNTAGTGGVVTLTITVSAAAGAPAINSATTFAALPGVVLATPYQITTFNSDATSFAASGLPVGVSLDTTAGSISGQPSAAGVYTVTLTASNATGTSSPFTLTVTVGAAITNASTASGTAGTAFSLTLTSSPSAVGTTYNVSGLPAGLTASAGGVISGSPTTAGTYLLTASATTLGTAPAAGGTGASSTITLTVAPASGGGGGGGGITPVPTITVPPVAVSVAVGGTANFAVTATSSTGGSLTYQWLLGGAAIVGQTNSTLALTNVQAAQAGNYSVTVTAVGGTSVTSTAVALTVGGVGTSVAITNQPVSQSINLGSNVTFTVAASGPGTLTYQWLKGGVAISGATGATFSITNVATSNAGSYTVTVTNGTTSATSTAAILTVTQNPATRLVNVSISGTNGISPQNLVVGLSIGGSGTKSVLIRAIGPTLATFGVANVLADPQLTLSSGLTQIGANDDWGGTNALSTAFTSTFAFPLPLTSKDSALLMNLAAGSTYTANVAGANGTTGTVLLEAYDADSAPIPTARFVNLSARGVAGSGANVMTIGFVISGTAPKTLLLRGIGPTLAVFGLGNVLPTTQLSLFTKAGATVSSNTGWAGDPTLAAAFLSVAAFSLPTTSADSALLVTLQPGTYTAQLTGANGSTASGLALLELYEMP